MSDRFLQEKKEAFIENPNSATAALASFLSKAGESYRLEKMSEVSGESDGINKTLKGVRKGNLKKLGAKRGERTGIPLNLKDAPAKIESQKQQLKSLE
jgi:hypothetical protein